MLQGNKTQKSQKETVEISLPKGMQTIDSWLANLQLLPPPALQQSYRAFIEL